MKFIKIKLSENTYTHINMDHILQIKHDDKELYFTIIVRGAVGGHKVKFSRDPDGYNSLLKLLV